MACVPDGVWLCKQCCAKGVTPEQVVARARSADVVPLTAAERQADAEAAQLDGRIVRRQFHKPGTRRRQVQPYLGKLAYRGADSRPNYFDVEFEDGDSQTMTLAEALLHLTPSGTVMPPPVVVAAVAPTLPSQWDLSNAIRLREVMQQLMPGQWAPAHLTRLANCMPGQRRFLSQRADAGRGQPECVPTLPEEVHDCVVALC